MLKHVNFKGGVSPAPGSDSTNFFSKISSGTQSFLTSKKLLYLVAAVFFISIGIYYYYYYVSPKLNPTFKANNEMMPSNDASGEAEIMLFYAEWCPHCKTAKPAWNEIKDEYSNKSVNGYNVVFTEIDCTTDTPESEKMMNQYNVEGFPTIKMLKDGQVIEFDAKPSRDTLNQFLNSVL